MSLRVRTVPAWEGQAGTQSTSLEFMERQVVNWGTKIDRKGNLVETRADWRTGGKRML